MRRNNQKMNLTTELERLNKARLYDLSALGEIYDLYSPGIFRYAMRLLGDEVLAEDCVSDTFSRFLKSLHNGNGPREHLKAYLYRIAHNWITDYYRLQPPIQITLDDSFPGNKDCCPEKLTEYSLTQNQVRMALRKLTPDQRQVITLRFIEGWDNAEIAAVVQKPSGAIKALQHRAINQLRKLLLPDEKENY